ncbi:MAG: hypothetical protein AAF297_03245 [Planctomycetota bacterium]
MRLIKLAVLIAATLALAFVGRASADDTIVLNDGTEITGEIVRELDGNIWLLEKIGTVEIERFYAKTQIADVMRDAPAVRDADPREEERERRSVSRPGVPKGAVISLEGMVGMQMTSDKLRDLIPILEEEIGDDGTGIVVLKINSGGGYGYEVQRLSDVIHNEMKPKFRVVAWIESAISAAAMTSHAIEEIVFMPRGNYGAATGWSGQLVAVKGRGLEEFLYQMEQISARGGYDHRIMRAMQISVPLSASIDTRNGEVQWFLDSDAGDMLVNPAGEILTFNSKNAYELGFSKGTASNLDELTEILALEEIDWVGKIDPSRIYPISKAEAEMIRFREKASEDESRFNEYMTNYNLAIGAAQGANDDIRGALVARARRQLRNVISMVRNNPNVALFILNVLPDDFPLWVEEQEEMLRDIARGP